MIKKLLTGTAVAGLSALAAISPTQAKNITFLIAYGPGGGFDTVTRKLAPLIEKHYGSKINVVPKNMPGGRGKKAANYLVNRKPNGMNMLMFNMPGHAMPNIIGEKADYDVRTIDWLARAAQFKYVIVTSERAGKFKSWKDVTSYKDKIKIPMTAPGTTGYLATAILFDTFGLKPQFITGYKSSSKYALGVIRGDGDLTILSVGSFRKYISSKKKDRQAFKDLRPLLELTNGRSEYGVETTGGLGKKELDVLGGDRMIGTTPGTPKAIKDKLANAVFKAVSDPEFAAWGKKVGRDIAPLNAEQTKAKALELFAYYSKFKSVLAASVKK
ncbi:MAG: hypothetical protein VW226_10100 [Rhodospirillaceae bacterium]|jgi:tripartite-type tricarboxylate transporter receptor subunit TctC